MEGQHSGSPNSRENFMETLPSPNCGISSSRSASQLFSQIAMASWTRQTRDQFASSWEMWKQNKSLGDAEVLIRALHESFDFNFACHSWALDDAAAIFGTATSSSHHITHHTPAEHPDASAQQEYAMTMTPDDAIHSNNAYTESTSHALTVAQSSMMTTVDLGDSHSHPHTQIDHPQISDDTPKQICAVCHEEIGNAAGLTINCCQRIVHDACVSQVWDHAQSSEFTCTLCKRSSHPESHDIVAVTAAPDDDMDPHEPAAKRAKQAE
eukprot:c8323_g1_i2.p1 GENE.c8323_g1_i2~~c8323_g1_i2.p1  ORF type:complete len:267 (+),score=52.46 c8323_g1_i2:71-871(+)